MTEIADPEPGLREIARRFSHPSVDYLGPACWRVWVHGWHTHSFSGHGSFAAQGKTAAEAAERLLRVAAEHPVEQGSSCHQGCPHYTYDGY